MAKHNELGREGEVVAKDLLLKKGYRILDLNWKHGRKEVDIIARKQDVIAFVEVKTRSTDYFGRPEEFVTLSKQKRLIKAADAYVQYIKDEVDVRFDVISVLKQGNEFKLEHIVDAYRPLI